MSIKSPIHHLLSKEMDRKQFLAHIGGIVLTILGISAILKAISGHPHRTSGYGSSTYGDKK